MFRTFADYRKEIITSDRLKLNEARQTSSVSLYSYRVLLNLLYQAKNKQELHRASANVYSCINFY